MAPNNTYSLGYNTTESRGFVAFNPTAARRPHAITVHSEPVYHQANCTVFRIPDKRAPSRAGLRMIGGVGGNNGTALCVIILAKILQHKASLLTQDFFYLVLDIHGSEHVAARYQR
ncbi:hypothetical protein D9757_010772 [Collybiopsis confluens]|uniref:Uncharacterized protein n=1 Tax=Collybiopsis confluens TaxID=2823264 RepID=A0A8H5H834_9AGAR|nr:hypothetical protein D9757_010772 [Collybiopsis confluens]